MFHLGDSVQTLSVSLEVIGLCLNLIYLLFLFVEVMNDGSELRISVIAGNPGEHAATPADGRWPSETCQCGCRRHSPASHAR